MLPDPVVLNLNEAETALATYNVIESGSRRTIRRGALTGTIPGSLATHAPLLAAEVSHQGTKAGRERSMLKLSLSTTHASTGSAESASVSIVLDSLPNGALRAGTVQVLLIQLTNLLNAGFGAPIIDSVQPSIDTVLGQFINGEA